MESATIGQNIPLSNQQQKGVNQRSKDVTQTQQQRLESPTLTLTWHASKHKVHKLHERYILWFRFILG